MERRAEGPRDSESQKTRRDPRSRPKPRGVATAAATLKDVGAERCGSPEGEHGDGKGIVVESGIMTVLNERLMVATLWRPSALAA